VADVAPSSAWPATGGGVPGRAPPPPHERVPGEGAGPPLPPAPVLGGAPGPAPRRVPPLARGLHRRRHRQRSVASFSVGIDRVDLAKCRERGIRVTNTPDVLTDDVADLAFGLAIAVLRRISQSDRYVRAGLWKAKGDYALTTRVRRGLLPLFYFL
jgi:hypothetical protein